ncbi:MAG: hypothetical protein SF182_06130 [Deltaproteobacteria bacterium]|nr:hypothetical protein [Deltaproteobacteria bacterium]
MRRLLLCCVLLFGIGIPAAHAAPTEPIALQYLEGDYAGSTTIWSEDGRRVIGYIFYRQHRDGDVLKIERVARFRDGSSDEDTVEARVGQRLEAIGGRSIIRDARGKPIVDLTVDVAKKRVSGFYVDEGKRETVNDEVDIGPGTYWGPLYMLVVKNLAANARDGKVVVQSILPTPKPRVIDMEFARDGEETIRRTGGTTKAERVTLLPTVNFLIDPILQRLVPKTVFYLAPGAPPAVARFAGPRNYAGQMMRLE